MARKPASPAAEAHVLPISEILSRLHALGYFGDKTLAQAKKIRGAELQKAVRAFQKFNGLPTTGKVEPVTAHRINRRRCGLPDFNITAPGGDPCKWPMPNISYYHEMRLPGLTDHQIAEAYDIAFSQWAEVCAIEPVRVDTHKKANIYARSGTGKKHGLDNKGGTLAWSELPCGVAENIQLDQMYDEAEDWSFNMAVAVICHELGHALGLPHLNAGNLMAPYYDPNVTKPQIGDVDEIVKLYGKRTTMYPITKDAGLQISGTLIINGRPYVLVPQT
jgi:matrix metalloproteinase-25 (membrane-inserted)